MAETSGITNNYNRTNKESNNRKFLKAPDLNIFIFEAEKPKVVIPKKSPRKVNYTVRYVQDSLHGRVNSPALKKRKERDNSHTPVNQYNIEPFPTEMSPSRTPRRCNQEEVISMIGSLDDPKRTLPLSPQIVVLDAPKFIKNQGAAVQKKTTIRRSLSLMTLAEQCLDESPTLKRRNSFSILENQNDREEFTKMTPKRHVTIPVPFKLSERKLKCKTTSHDPYKKLVFEKTLRIIPPSLIKPLSRNVTVPKPFDFKLDKRKRKADCDCCKLKFFNKSESNSACEEKRQPIKCKRQIEKRVVNSRIRTNFAEIFGNKKNDHRGSSSSNNSNEKSAQTGRPFEKKPPTVPKPFRFQFKHANQSKKIESMTKDSQVKYEFKAQCLPDFETITGLPNKSTPKLTIQEPFVLETEIRGAVHVKKFNEKVQEECREMEKMASFKARDCLVLTNPPFEVKKSDYHSIEILPLELHTEKRAVERKQFDERIEKKFQENEERSRLRELEKLKKELDEEKQLRARLVHKARPVPRYILNSHSPSRN